MQVHFYLGILFSLTGCCAFGFPPCASLYTSYISSTARGLLFQKVSAPMPQASAR